MMTENFTIVLKGDSLRPRALENLVNGLGNRLHCQPIVTDVPGEDGFDKKIVMPGKHDFEDVSGLAIDVKYWVGSENVVDFSLFGKKA